MNQSTPNVDYKTADQKALRINLDRSIFGVFAEIGAGQEVVRHFFQVGAAAGTIAKTISAYDMIVSDEIYGKAGRYVSRERLEAMLQHEYKLLLERLSAKVGGETTFFVFADTVAARNFQGTNECHGWMGVRFQTEPLGPPNDIIIHVRMTDRANVLQQQALGIIGVNLVYGAFYLRQDPAAFIKSLLDELSLERIEVDMIDFSGPAMQGIDDRLMALKLVQNGLTNAIMFAPDRSVLQPSEVLRKRPVLVERGSFRPVTNVNLDMMKCARAQFHAEPGVQDKDPVVLFEITLHNLVASGSLDDSDFLARADTLSALGYTVLISNYSEHYRLAAYFRRYTNEFIGMAMGINTLLQIFDDQYYLDLEGGLLEAFGRLFKKQVKLYIYPMRREDYVSFLQQKKLAPLPEDLGQLPETVTVEDVRVFPQLRHLYKHLRESHAIEPITGPDEKLLSIVSREILSRIQQGTGPWEEFVPPSVAALIKQRHIFGYQGKPSA